VPIGIRNERVTRFNVSIRNTSVWTVVVAFAAFPFHIPAELQPCLVNFRYWSIPTHVSHYSASLQFILKEVTHIICDYHFDVKALGCSSRLDDFMYFASLDIWRILSNIKCSRTWANPVRSGCFIFLSQHDYKYGSELRSGRVLSLMHDYMQSHLSKSNSLYSISLLKASRAKSTCRQLNPKRWFFLIIHQIWGLFFNKFNSKSNCFNNAEKKVVLNSSTLF